MNVLVIGEKNTSGGRGLAMLKSMMEDAGFDNLEVTYIPALPDNFVGDKPKKKELDICRKWLKHRIDGVNPNFILLVGALPLQVLLGLSGVKKLRGKPITQGNVIILPTISPSAMFHDPSQRPIIEKDLKEFRDIVDFGGIPYERGVNLTIIDSWPKFRAMLKELHGIIAYDLETSGLYPWGLRPLIQMPNGTTTLDDREKTWITSIILGCSGKQYVIPLNHSRMSLGDKGWYVPKIPTQCQYAVDKKAAYKFMGREAQRNENAQADLWDELIPVLEDCEVVGHNMKFDVIWTWVKTGRRLHISFDTMLAHYNLNENSLHDLEHLASFYFGAKNYDIPLHEKHGFGPLDRHCQYGASDGYYTRKLRLRLMKDLKNESSSKRIFDHITLPAANLFCEIEYNGVYINEAKMDIAEKYLREEIAKAEVLWNKWGRGVNMASPKQVGNLLYGKLRIKCPQLTPKGGKSTSESTLNQIDHPCVAALLKFRGAKQQLSFFIEGWKPYLINSRLHPSFKLHGTVTGRPSCENPNLQQVPRDPRIRSLICTPPGRELIEADLSQIELRVAAWLAEERNMTKVFRDGLDAHWMTCLNELSRAGAKADLILKTAKAISNDSKVRYAEAIQILLKAGPDVAAAIDKEWKEFRKKAKAVNFGYLYGMWWKKFKMYARDNYGVEVTDEEAQDSRISFFETYPDFPKWHDKQKRFARMNGFVKNPLGRKRRLPAAMSKEDTPQRREAERQAINSPVQSFASDLNLLVAIQLRKEMPGKEIKINGTIHDAILVDVDEKHTKRVAKRILEIMTGPDLLKELDIEIPIPILGEAKVGPWSEGRDVKF
jgi:DNA polymerase-1